MSQKLIVAIHGIGDQIRHETAQSVAFRFFDYYDLPPALPLGRFYHADPLVGVAVMEAPANPQLAFAEAYWADIPRELVKEQHTLEEAKRWARTIVARLNFRAWQAQQSGLTLRQYRMLEAVLDEMIDTIFVLENLTFLASKAGLFTFDLKTILDDYLNDVQVVTEFEKYRGQIVGGLDRLMGEVEKVEKLRTAELYIVGHSEGSVVAFLGLLNALSKTEQEAPAWIHRVRGLMTIGSPIETHQILWENLWSFEPGLKLANAIPWWNYFDYGDPIAYRLERTREWMDARGWTPYFMFPQKHDVGFSRYPLPGKAHVDYWHDRGVFDHFIDEVVKPGALGSRPTGAPKPKRRKNPAPMPRSKFVGRIGRPLPYFVTAVVLFLAVFALYKPVQDVLQPAAATVPPGRAESAPAFDLTSLQTFGNLIGFAWLLAAITLAVRVPRLTDLRTSPRLWVVAALFCAGAFVFYPRLVQFETRRLMDAVFINAGWNAGDSMALRLTAAAVMVAASVWSFLKPKRGVRPILVLGALMVGGIVGGMLAATEERLSLWPVVVGAAFFLYLWWLATLLFDLSIVWHTYVRYSEGVKAMHRMVGKPKASVV